VWLVILVTVQIAYVGRYRWRLEVAAISAAAKMGHLPHRLCAQVGGQRSGNFNFASIFDPFGTNGGDASAGTGNGDFAYVVGDGDLDRAGGVASTLLGSYDIAEIFGNGGMADSGASVGAPGSFDFAEIFGNELDALAATGGNFLVDLAPPL
jgi:hypothetical protein